jgi:glycosyltransferase involved in cell wall biosynthesis
LYSIFAKHRPDVICIEQEPFSLSTFQIILLKNIFKYKVVIVSNQNLYKVYPQPFRWIESYCLRHTDMFYGVTGSVVPVWLKKGMPQSKIDVLAQVGVSPNQFKPTDGHRAQFGVKKFAFGYAGRFVEEKGIHVFLEAFARMKNRDQCELLLIGRGPYEPNLRNIIKHYSLDRAVKFVDGIKHHEMPNVLNALDVLVLPSLVRRHWKEQFGHIIIEAQACGKPVIGSDCDPIPEVIGRGGLACVTEDPDSFAQAMDQISMEPELYRNLANEALLNVKRRFTNEVIADKLVNCFRRLIAEEPQPSRQISTL